MARPQPPALSVWSSPRIEVTLAVEVLTTRQPSRLEYSNPQTNAVDYAITLAPSDEPDTVLVEEGDRRDRLQLVKAALKGGKLAILFLCPGCARGVETAYFRALDHAGQIVRAGPRCQRCSRLSASASALGPWERAATLRLLESRWWPGAGS